MSGQYLVTDPVAPDDGEINMPRLDNKRQMLVSGLDAVVTSTSNIPPAGQATMANSLPVVIASDQSNVPVREQYAPVAEDNAAGRLLVEQRNSYTNITTATTTTIKSGSGFLHLIMVNNPAASATITIYDNTTGSGTKIATITQPAVLLATNFNFRYDVAFNTGLTIVTTGVQDLTVSFR